MSKKLDVIIFGASGFTGKYCVLEACTVLGNLKWGVAGRNKTKLETILEEMGGKANKDLSKVPIIIADVSDERSLYEMASKAKIIVNCCGPYRFYGEQVVKTCIEAGAHHVDVSGEIPYIESMQLKYHDMAKKKGVYVVSACAFDSIPADMGVIFLEKNFEGGVMNSVEVYYESYMTAGSYGGASFHYGTWESAVYMLGDDAEDLYQIQSKLKSLPKFRRPTLEDRSVIHRSEVIEGICLPFPGTDEAVIQSSQRFLFKTEKKRPIQVRTYFGFRSIMTAFTIAFVALVFGILVKFTRGRQLLLNYPKLFSLGLTSHQGPSEAKCNATRFRITIKGNGWPKEKLFQETDRFIDPPSKNMIAKVTGSNPVYGVTCVSVLVAAKTILMESDKMPGSGGVIPPGAAFSKTNIIAELEKYDNGIKFEIISNR